MGFGDWGVSGQGPGFRDAVISRVLAWHGSIGMCPCNAMYLRALGLSGASCLAQHGCVCVCTCIRLERTNHQYGMVWSVWCGRSGQALPLPPAPPCRRMTSWPRWSRSCLQRRHPRIRQRQPPAPAAGQGRSPCRPSRSPRGAWCGATPPPSLRTYLNACMGRSGSAAAPWVGGCSKITTYHLGRSAAGS